MAMNRKFLTPSGQVYIYPNTDQYATSVILTDENSYTDDQAWLYLPENEMLKLFVVTTSARLTTENEMPSWMANKNIVKFDRTVKEFASYNLNTKEFVIDEEIVLSERGFCCSYASANEVLAFAMDILFDKNKFIYELITKTITTNVNVYKLTDGILTLVQNPEKMTVIETMSKTVGEKMALKSILNDIEVGAGKSKKAILSQTQMQSIKTLKLDDSLASFQRMVQTGVLSLNQLDELIQAMKYFIKFKFITHSELTDVISRYEDNIVSKKINLLVVLEGALKSFLNYYDISGKHRYARRYYYGYSDHSFKKLLSIYLDAIIMLDDKQAENPKYYRTDNVEIYHAITVRNVKMMQNASDEDFELARVRLRKMVWENSEYVFRPFKDKEETAYAGSRLNNCLGACIQGICDGRVIIAAFRKEPNGTLGDCPEFVCEFTPHLDVIEVSTYNNVDIVDPERLKIVRDYIESRRYLLSNGRSVYRDPDPKEEEKAKKAELNA